MGDRRFGFVLLLAIAVAGASAFGVYRMLQQAQAEARVPTLPVVVAAADISDGQIVAATDVNVVELPVSAVPPGSFRTTDSVIGRVSRLPIFTGEAFVPGRLAPVGTGAGLEVKITPGKRAMAVKIDEVAGLSGLIQPNSRVDVLLTINDGSDGAQQRAKLIMSNMRVLSVGSQVERGPDGRPMNATTAALEVTPIESEELAVAANQGKIQLVLRGYGDPDTVDTDGATVRQVMGGRAAAPAPAPASPRASRPTPAPTQPAPVVTPPPVVQQPKRPDSAVVQVYRRSAVTQQKLEIRDTTKPPDTLPR
jgi:pilus assembly protein CpaB